MDEINDFSNSNPTNKNTDEIINRIQNSLNRLQSAINNKQLLDNLNNNQKNIQNNNLNIRKKTLDSQKISRINKTSVNEDNIQSNIIYDNNNSIYNYSSVMNTDKRNTQRKMNQNRILTNSNFDDNINRTTEYIIPKSTQRRNYYNKINYYNYNRNKYTNINSARKKCLNCGNINPPQSKFCFNCGEPINNIIKNQYNTYNEKINTKISVIKPNNINKASSRNIENIKDNQICHSEIQMQSYNNIDISKSKNINKDIPISKSNKIMNNIYQDLNDIQNEDLINYKKLNDLYLYGDYLENELKTSNDENVKLLENFKKIKIQVHSLNQKNNKIKQNIEALKKKEKYITKLNEGLKNGFNFTQQNLGNNEEQKKTLNELELTNKKYLEIQTDYEKQIENLKKNISSLVDNDEKEEDDEYDTMIKNLENDIEKDKKELENKNAEYMLLIKKNELLNEEIINLGAELDIDLEENEEEECGDNLVDGNDNDNNINNKKSSNILENEKDKDKK